MKRRAVVAAAAGGLAALAGCSALPMWDDGSIFGESDDDVPAADPSGGHGDGPDVTYPPGYVADGIDSPSEAVGAHVDGLLSADSYIFGYESLLHDGEGQAAITIQQIADNRSEAGYTIRDDGEGAIVQYYEDGTVFIRVESDDDVEYHSQEASYAMADFTGAFHVGPLLENVDYGDAEVLDGDDERFFRYTSEEVTNPGGVLRQDDVDESRIDRFDVSFVVDENGIVRHAMFVVDADASITVEMGVSEIDTATIDRPEWFDEADDA